MRDASEEAAINQARLEKGLGERATKSLPLKDLEPFERQALAVYRGCRASIAEWVRILRELLKKHERDPNSRTSLQGVLLRVEPLLARAKRRLSPYL